jgi:type II secretory pathway predicted ATPase ExeA
MFLQYYGLRKQPFGTTPDPRLLYLSASHREALASLIYGIETGRGFMALIAEPGMGKTTLLFQLMERLQNSARTVFLFQTQGNARDFLSNLIADLGLDPSGQDISSLHRQLNEVLIRDAQMHKQFVLVIDEAQNLDDSVLELVRMLSNFETSHSKLMQIVLAGQPQLADKLSRPEMEQFRQRVSILGRLSPFSKEEVASYVKHRLLAAGYKGRPLFTPEALAMLAEQSGGIPRNINNLCFHALSLGCAKAQRRIDRSILEEVFADLSLEFVRTQSSGPCDAGAQAQNARFDVGSVTLGGSPQAGKRGGKLYGGIQSLRSSQRRNSLRNRPQGNTAGRWLKWAVALPAIILIGEMIWAYLPPGLSRRAVTESIVAAAQEARKVAFPHGISQPSRPPAAQTPTNLQREVVGSNDEDPGQAQPTRDPAAPASAQNSDSENQPAAVPSDEGTVGPGKISEPSPGAQQPSTSVQRPAKKSAGTSSAEDFGPSADSERGKVVIESNSTGSQITINGETQPHWQTPHIFSLPLGTYRISVSKPGYATWYRDVQVTEGSKEWVMADLVLPRGVIVIDTEPQGMQVFIDGKPYGPSEVETALSAGTHSYQVIPPAGHQPISGTFVLKPGDILTRKISMPPSSGRPDAENRAGPSPWNGGRTIQ